VHASVEDKVHVPALAVHAQGPAQVAQAVAARASHHVRMPAHHVVHHVWQGEDRDGASRAEVGSLLLLILAILVLGLLVRGLLVPAVATGGHVR
jgi:hypothetical protein